MSPVVGCACPVHIAAVNSIKGLSPPLPASGTRQGPGFTQLSPQEFMSLVRKSVPSTPSLSACGLDGAMKDLYG